MKSNHFKNFKALTLRIRHVPLVDTPACDGCKGFMKLSSHQRDLFLLTFKSFYERIHALAKPISGQTQDNYYSRICFHAKPSALSYTPNNVVAIIFRLVAATPFVAVPAVPFRSYKRIFLNLGHS
ncbi:hypothetical protein TNCV_4348001 [Trichonephila clavipes]|nr:hypothetical protein TNCV_4348001 [Trichonephila clavipes]